MVFDFIFVVLGLVGGYIFGSIPFGLVLTHLAGTKDIRTIGSGSIGATNVLRTGRKDLAVLTLLLDSGKGAFAVLFFGMLSPYAAIAAALGSIGGHLFSCFLNFKGGKGIATAAGALLVLTPFAGIIGCMVWLIMAFSFKTSSIASLAAAAIVPLAAGMAYGELYGYVTMIITVMVFYKHKDNIKRIMNGTEPKIGTKA